MFLLIYPCHLMFFNTEVQPYSITGSLPLVRNLQDNDYDVQLVGYGLSSK